MLQDPRPGTITAGTSAAGSSCPERDGVCADASGGARHSPPDCGRDRGWPPAPRLTRPGDWRGHSRSSCRRWRPSWCPAPPIAALTACAATLAPIHRAGFECRLGHGDDQVDFQQGIPGTDGEPARLAAFLEQAEAGSPAWQAVQRLVTRWVAPGDVVRDAVSELWLEFDLPAAGSPRAARSGAVAVRRARAGGPNPRAAGLACGTGDDFRRERAAPLTPRSPTARPRLPAWRAGQPHRGDGRARAHRDARARQRHPAPRPPGATWTRPAGAATQAELTALASMLLDLGDQIVLCLDVADGLTPARGPRVLLRPTARPRPPLASAARPPHGARPLRAREGRCPAALARQPSRRSIIAADWPEDLIVQSLTRPPDVLGVIERRLSHVKLTCTPEHRVTAKAYFGFGHLWVPAREPSTRHRARRAGSGRRRPPRSRSARRSRG